MSTTNCPLATLTPYPWTKFVVPSTGSMIHVGLLVKTHGSPFATDSSPMKLQHRRTVTPISKYDRATSCLCYKHYGHTKVHMGVCVRVLPVCAFSEFLFKRPNDDFLHSLIGLGDEVYGGAFCHDPYFTLPGFLNLLNKWNTIGTWLGS